MFIDRFFFSILFATFENVFIFATANERVGKLNKYCLMV